MPQARGERGMSRPATQRVTAQQLACLDLLSPGPSSAVWTLCKTGTIDACERRGLIRDTGRRDLAVLRIFELTSAGRAALIPEPAGRDRGLWD